MKISKKAKRWIVAIAVILGVVLIGALLNGLGAFDSVKDSVRDKMEGYRNEANLIEYDATYKALDGTEKGITFSVSKDGSIKIDGTATEDLEILLNTVDRPAGLITLGAVDFGIEDGDRAYITVADSSDVYRSYAKSDVVFSVAGNGDPLMVKLVIKAGTVIENAIIRPTLNTGVDAIDYYSAN